MKSIGIDDLKLCLGDSSCYADDCLFVSESLQYLCDAEPVRLDFSLMVFCISGFVRWEQNGRTCTLGGRDFGIILSGISLAEVSVGTGCRIKVVGLSDRFMQRMFQSGTDVWRLVRFVKLNPMKRLDDRMFELLLCYIDLIGTELSIGDTVRRRDIIHHLFAAFVLGMISDIKRCMETSFEKERVNSSTYIFKRFVEELYADNGHHRSVSYYADKLCCSPTYLSRLVKKMSGEKALALINEHAVERIAFELKHSDKTIKEIAMEFDFPNVSFFAKYVRKHLKVSPTAFRNGL